MISFNMKHFLIAAAVAATTATTPVFAADVGLSISIGDPNFYGRLDIGGYPAPQVINTRPIIIERARESQPIYLRVPPGHAKHWDRHCREYNACGEQVYFVADDWYHRDYVPYYQERHREHRHDRYKGHDGKHHSKHNDRHDDRDHGNH